ncbi:MAG: FtsQ-type POTRA domain-containing protein [Gemella sp.]|nr:FtsQ-type POTRA domain-containing protein [Gemella sp.]
MKKRKILENSRKKNYKSALERYKNKRRKELAILLSIITIIAAFIIFFNSSFVAVKNVNVNGLVQLEKNEIVETLDLNSDVKIWNLNEEEFERKIKDKYNIVASVNVEKKLLNTLNIHIQEKKLLVQEKKDDKYIKLLEDGQEYTGKIVKNYYLPVIENFSVYPVEKTEILKSLSELDFNILSRISEISFDETNKETATIYMRDGQRIRVNIVNFSSKLNHYDEIERFIENKRSTVLNLINGTYLETEGSENEKTNRINLLLNERIETPTTINNSSTTN